MLFRPKNKTREKETLEKLKEAGKNGEKDYAENYPLAEQIELTGTKKTKGSEEVLKPEALLNMLEDLEEANENIKESEKKFRQLSENSPNMIFINKDGKIIYANNECEHIMVYKINEFYSQKFNFLSLIDPESSEIVRENFQRHLSGKEVSPYECKLITKNGRTIWTIIHTKLIDYDKGKAILGIITDITKQKNIVIELRKSEGFIKEMIDNSGIPIVAFGKQDNLLIANTDFLEMTGYKKDEIGNKDKFYENIFPSKLVMEKIDPILSDVHKGKRVKDFVVPIRCKDGSTIITVANLSAVKDENGKIAGEIIFMRDLSEIFGLEDQLRYWSANGFVQVRVKEEGGRPQLSLTGEYPSESLIEKKFAQKTKANG